MSLVCRICAQQHREPKTAQRHTRLSCSRCGKVLSDGRPLVPGVSAGWALAGLILTVPSLTLPFIDLGRYGAERVSYLHSQVSQLWNYNMPVVSALVLFSAAFFPASLLVLLLTPYSAQTERKASWRIRFVEELSFWAMPEVQALGVLVSLFKLGTVVDVRLEAGFWCYAAMSMAMLLAWSSFRAERRWERVAHG